MPDLSDRIPDEFIDMLGTAADAGLFSMLLVVDPNSLDRLNRNECVALDMGERGLVVMVPQALLDDVYGKVEATDA